MDSDSDKENLYSEDNINDYYYSSEEEYYD